MARRKNISEDTQVQERAEVVGLVEPVSSSQSVARAEQGVQDFFGRSPEEVVQPLHRSVEAFNWLGELFQCIEEANSGDDRAQSAGRIQALASLGAYIAADYQVSIIGEPADNMQACVEAAREDMQHEED